MLHRPIGITHGILIVQGSLAILFGATAMLWPGLTTLALAYLFAAYLIVDGSVLLVLGLGWKGPRRAHSRVGWGLVQVLLGLFVLYNPDVTFGVLILILGLTLMVRGVFSLAHALFWKHETIGDRTLHAVQGALGVVIGAVVTRQPAVGGLAFVWILGLYALVVGTVLIALALGAGRPKHASIPPKQRRR